MNSDFFYDIQHEKVNAAWREKESISYYILEDTPIVKGTVNGFIYIKNQKSYAFTVSKKGIFTFNRLTQDCENTPINGIINWDSGEIIIAWTEPAVENYIIVDYECDPICISPYNPETTVELLAFSTVKKTACDCSITNLMSQGCKCGWLEIERSNNAK